MQLLNDPYQTHLWVRQILQERLRLMAAVAELPYCKKVYPTDANFFLAKVDDAPATYKYLMENGVIVRNRHSVTLCENCLRITIGTRGENNELLAAMRKM